MQWWVRVCVWTIGLALVVGLGCGSTDGGEENDDEDVEEVGVQVCVDACDEAADCGAEHDYDCVDGACEPVADGASGMCEEARDCVAMHSGWLGPCDEGADCAGTAHCVEFDGQGFCAMEAHDDHACHKQKRDKLKLDVVGGDGGSVTVCGKDGFSCHRGDCVPHCEDDVDCANEGADRCVEGVCGCSGDEVCSDGRVCR